LKKPSFRTHLPLIRPVFLLPLLALVLSLGVPSEAATTTKKKTASKPATTRSATSGSTAKRDTLRTVPKTAPKPTRTPTAPATTATVSAPDTGSVIVRIVDFIAHPALQVATWPVQNVLAPGAEFLTYPAQPPMRYFIEENVIDRSVGLFQFGHGGDISVYPTVSLASGTGSRTGVTMRDESPFDRDTERLVGYFQYYVNGDYRMRSYLAGRSLLGTPLQGKVAVGINRFESATYYLPDVNTSYAHANHSETYETQLDAPTWAEFYLRSGFTLRNNRFDEAPDAFAQNNQLEGGFFRDENGDTTAESRGFNQDFFDRIWLVGLVRDTRNNENITLDGSRFEAAWYYHDADLNHDFHEWQVDYTKYFKLGAERYEITDREERQRGGTSVSRFLRRLEYQRLRQSIFSRKVLVTHVFAGQSYEVSGNRMPYYGLQALGNSTPLRAYPGSRYRDYAVLAAGGEYRFPILRIMDGTLFNEYGVFGASMGQLDFVDNLRNSWGFGIRVRQPDMFLFRIEMAFRGLSGAVLNVNADTPF
jgi:hypothetical protein